MGQEKTQDHLKPQDASSVDASKLTALTPEVVRCVLILIFEFESNKSKNAHIFPLSISSSDCFAFPCLCCVFKTL